MDSIELEVKELVKNYPLIAGLTSISTVIHHLPQVKPFPPSLFSSKNSNSLQIDSTPEEPLFNQYGLEISTLLSSSSSSRNGSNSRATGGGGMNQTNAGNENEIWKKQQLERIRSSLLGSKEVEEFKGSAFGGVKFLPPPFPISSTSTSNSTLAPTSPTSTLALQFLDSLQISKQPIFNPPVALPTLVEPDPEKFFQEFLREKKVGRVTRSSAATAASASASASASANANVPARNGCNPHLAVPPVRKSLKPSSSVPTNFIPISSPDPLRIISSSNPNTIINNNQYVNRTSSLPTLNALGLPTSSSQASSIPIQRNQSHSEPHNGSQPTLRLLNSPPPSSDINHSSPLSSNLSDTSTTNTTMDANGKSHDFAVVIESPRKKIKNLSITAQGTSGNGGKKVTDSQKAFNRGEGETPMKSAVGDVKRIRLVEGSIGTAGYNGSSARNNDSKDLIDKFSDLISDLFSADDSYINDTSTSHLNPSNSSSSHHNAAFEFFQPNQESTGEVKPLLQSEFLRKLIKILFSIKSKSKGEELVEEVEVEGIGRLLKILERSWNNREELIFWDKEVMKEKKELMDDGVTSKKGKGKAGVRRGSKAKSKPMRKKGGSSKNEEEDDDDSDEEGNELTYSPTKSLGGMSLSTNGGGGRASRSRSNSPMLTNKPNEMDLDDVEEESIWTEETLLDFEDALHSISNAILSIRVALALLTISPSLPKQLYSSDFITSIFSVLRHSLDGFLFPLLEANSRSHLYELTQSSTYKDGIQAICNSIEAVIPLVNTLVHNEEMSEEIVISTVYYSLSSFFHEAASSSSSLSGSGKGKKVEPGTIEKAMKGIRMVSLGLIRTVIGRYPGQRAWIIEEVLSNLTRLEAAKKGKGGFRLRNGTSIHTISALILHLVQTSPSDFRGLMKTRLTVLPKDKLIDIEMRDVQEEAEEENEEDVGKPPLELAIRDLLDPALDSATKSARTVISYLLTKSCKAGKVAAGSTESEYRAVFDNLITDLLATLHLPEWPASEVLVSVCCKSMITTLADSKTTNEINALKGVSLDHIGPIAARIRKDVAATFGPDQLDTLQEAFTAHDVESLDSIVSAELEILDHLSQSEKSEGSSEGAAAFTSAIFGRELYHTLQASNALLSQFTPAQQLNSDEGRLVKAFNDRINHLSTNFWMNESRDDIFAPSTADDQLAMDSLSVQLARSQSLAGLYDTLLDRIVDAAESSVVSFRTKALRGISLIVAQDPDLFHRTDVKKSIENRMLDSSPAVRDTTIELVGKYVVGRLDLAVEYLPQICDRIVDTGLGVRRRVVKLLKTLYSTLEQEDHRVEIATRLVWRVLDEDDGIKDLAVEALEELWFTRPLLAKQADTAQSTDIASKHAVAHLAAVIMSVTGGLTGQAKDRPPPVDDVLRSIIAKHVEKGTKPPLDRLRQVTEALIDGLVEDDESMNVVACIKTIHILNSADPSLLSTAKATLLLPFLKSATGPEELAICEYLLKIFRSTVIASPKAGSKFARDLQSSLTLMLNKPTLAGGILPHIVACFCAVIRGQTHDFTHMVEVFTRCTSRLAGELKTLRNPATASKGTPRSIPLLANLSALLCEHGRFDDIRRNFPETKDLIDAVATTSISDHVFQMLVDLYNLRLGPAIQMQILSPLGFIFRAYPQLMTIPKSTAIMDGIFASNIPQAQAHLLKVIQEFLASQERPDIAIEKAKVETGIKIAELVGNVDGFADSGVSSAICQRYDTQIIAAALSLNPILQRVSIEILTSMARSGFIHPLSVLPPLVALTASPDAAIARKSFTTLSLVQQKHGNLCATRFAEPAKVCHSYTKTIAGDNAIATGYRGDPPTSHFGPWYNLVREKRATRLDYLKTLSRMLELEPGAKCTENDVSLARFVAEALSTLDYKTQEEPMSVIAHLNSLLAVAGLQVLHLLEEGIEGGGGLLGSSAPSSPVKIGTTSMDMGTDSVIHPPSASLANQSIICGVALLLKDHLKILYSITEIKMSKFKLGKKSPTGDRQPIMKNDVPLALGLDSYERMPYAVNPLKTSADRIEQRDTYITLIGSDGTIGPLELEIDEED